MSTNTSVIEALHASELYLYFYAEDLEDERTRKECEFIKKQCEIHLNSRVLDLACGHGRHSIFFTHKAYNVTGIDINKDFIQLAQSTARKEQLKVAFKHQNILDIEYEAEFDLVYLLSNTLGFFDRKDCGKLFQKVANALKNGGKFFLDSKNRDHLLQELVPCSITEKGNDLMIDRLTFDPVTGTTTNNRIYIKDGKRYDTPFMMYAYNYVTI